MSYNKPTHRLVDGIPVKHALIDITPSDWSKCLSDEERWQFFNLVSKLHHHGIELKFKYHEIKPF